MKMLLNTKALKTTKYMKFKRKCAYMVIKPVPMKALHGITEQLMKSENKKGYKYYVSYGSRYNFKKETMPKSWYGEPVKVLYNGKYYDAPCEWDKVLKQLYGNYMKFPPEEERGGHSLVKIEV